jgi:hypothetical protein
MRKTLQVLINDTWEYVFCRNPLKRDPIITKDKTKAIHGDEQSLEYFTKSFSEHNFRIA